MNKRYRLVYLFLLILINCISFGVCKVFKIGWINSGPSLAELIVAPFIFFMYLFLIAQFVAEKKTLWLAPLLWCLLTGVLYWSDRMYAPELVVLLNSMFCYVSYIASFFINERAIGAFDFINQIVFVSLYHFALLKLCFAMEERGYLGKVI